MYKRLKVCLIFSFFVLINNSSSTSAKIYDWVRMGGDDIRVIVDPRVDAQLRLQMIREAKTSIDLITFDQRPDDEVGMPILDALEEAALKGVKVRFALAWLVLPIRDPRGLVLTRLKKIAAKRKNFQYILVGGPSMTKRGWKTYDSTHEKLLIIDDRLAATTGRGQGNEYFRWLDTGFVFKGPLVNQSIEAFGQLWKTLIRETPDRTNHLGGLDQFDVNDLKTISVPENSLTLQLSIDEVFELQSLTQWLLKPASNKQTYKARVLHHDFLDQMRNIPDVRNGEKIPSDYSIEDRIKLITDPVVEETVALLKTASTFRFTTISVQLHPRVKEALIARLEQSPKMPFELRLFTNSKNSHGSIALGLAFGWYAGLPDLTDLLQFQNVNEYVLAPPKNPGDPLFIHRKLTVVEHDPNLSNGRENTVIFGSHNLSVPSTATLDEISFEIESSEFASSMNELFEKSIVSHGLLLDRAETLAELTQHRTIRWISQFVKWAF